LQRCNILNAKKSLADRVALKVMLRLLPFLFVLYIVAYLDRINVSFAALQMNTELGFTDFVYGLGSGIFFVGYFIFEVPSNLIMERTGARVWIARIMITWGLLSAAMMFMTQAWHFYVLRFLLGVAEAGFFPGIILYLTYWFPSSRRARAVSWFMTATSVSGVIGGPLSGALLQLHGFAGYSGWQWLFLIEGLPAVALGIAVFFVLTDRPEQARWLDDEERACLVEQMREDEANRGGHDSRSFVAALKTPAVWLYCLVYFHLVIGFYGIGFWLPKIIRSTGDVGDFEVGYLSAIPNLVSVFTMVAAGSHSDRTGERRWHVAVAALIGAVGLVFCSCSLHSTLLVVFCMSLTYAGLRATLGPYWAMPTSYLRGTAAAGGIAFINSLGNLGGLVGPSVYGKLRETSGSHVPGLIFLATALTIASAVVLYTPYRAKPAAEMPCENSVEDGVQQQT
jgi:D-galactonate transporter